MGDAGVQAGVVLGWDKGRENPAGFRQAGMLSGQCRQGCGPAGASRWLPWLMDEVPEQHPCPWSSFHVDLPTSGLCQGAGQGGDWDSLPGISTSSLRVGFLPFAMRGGEGLDSQEMFWEQV